jgi:hypothetical protein
MSNIQIKNRLIESASPENEWAYLVNETLAGEKTIVPMLKKILDNPVCIGPFREMVEQQIDEEVQHVRLYHNLVGGYQIDRNIFRTEFSRFVLGLPTVTLKIFALQGMLEGIAMGALNYRLSVIENSLSIKEDTRALADETNHTSFSFPHFRHLIESEGEHSMEDFKNTSRV